MHISVNPVVLDRIPWVAPEVLDTLEIELECDKWSFGTTLWEIFNGGEAPLQGLDLIQVCTSQLIYNPKFNTTS